MKNYIVVSTKKELEFALKEKADKIIITDSDLAKNVKNIKLTSYVSLTAAIAGVGVAATNFWNPVGWGAVFFGAVAGSSTMITIIALGIGATLIFVIYNDYTIKAKGKVKMPDGIEVEGEVILEKN